MRVLLSAYGTRGDAEPLVALAAQLRALGVEVRMSAPPECAPRLAELDGVALVPLGPSLRPMLRQDASMSMNEATAHIAALVERQFAVIGSAADGCDAVVAAGIGQIAARSVAELRGIRYVYTSYAPAFLPSPHHGPAGSEGMFAPGADDRRRLWNLDAAGYNIVYRSVLNAHRDRLDLEPVDDVRAYMFTDRPWLAADPTLAPWPLPADLDVVQSGAWFLPDERPLAPEIVAFLDAGPPPIYVGFGSMCPDEGIARAVIESARAHGRRALLGSGWAGLSRLDDQDDCLVVDEVNHEILFTRVAAVVHHGGAGTTATAARAGVPQVVVAQVGDQRYWAQRVTALGLGAALDQPTPTPDALSAALDIALSAPTRARAGAVAPAVRADGAAVAARTLVDTVLAG